MGKTLFNQNSKGVYDNYKFSSTMTQLTVLNAPEWRKTKRGWSQVGTQTKVVGVARAKDFDFFALLDIAVNPPATEIAVA